jgi:uncharacterized membrane protein (DUF373 family)
MTTRRNPRRVRGGASYNPRMRTRLDWAVTSFYQRFEALVALVLTVTIGAVVIVALYRLGAEVVATLVLGSLNPLDHVVFQRVFGQILTVLIALEFNHTLRYVVAGEQSIIQTKVVVLIAVLAIARKVIVLDLPSTAGITLIGLGFLVLALGVAYRLIREGDDRLAPAPD